MAKYLLSISLEETDRQFLTDIHVCTDEDGMHVRLEVDARYFETATCLSPDEAEQVANALLEAARHLREKEET